ncbi:hydrogenase expression/formation protein HypE [Candidatus Woesearchaeota archaeon]|nr:MAG: hydrogenase expression/formation protein HypE [Candidatus Woesearchaeota archaeon]
MTKDHPRKDCVTGHCPSPASEPGDCVRLSEGGGGAEMHALLAELLARLRTSSEWEHQDNDAAVLRTRSRDALVFTTDSYVVTPLFFPGGDIGKIAMCGTINDLAVMGARPFGIALSLIIEEGFPKRDLFTILDSIKSVSEATGVPVVTGDTKVMERGAIDRIVITTSGVGSAAQPIDAPPVPGDAVIVSGTLGDHGATLLAKRFAFQTTLQTDSKPLLEEIRAVQQFVKQAKDITRGGLAAVLNELAEQHRISMVLEEDSLPVAQETRAVTNLLGLDPLMLACEGRFVCITAREDAAKVVRALQQFNERAAIIGRVQDGQGVTLKTRFGARPLQPPSGVLVPRIC